MSKLSHHKSAVVIATREEAVKFLADRTKTEKATPCCYGHYDCSSYNGGPCLDETIGNFPELDPDRGDDHSDDGQGRTPEWSGFDSGEMDDNP